MAWQEAPAIVSRLAIGAMAATGLLVAQAPGGAGPTVLPPGGSAPGIDFRPGNSTLWLVACVAVWFLGKVGDWAAQTRTKWLKADDGTDHKRYVECQEERARDREVILRLQGEIKSRDDAIAAAIVLHAAKDRQIELLNDQVTKQSRMVAEGVDRYGSLVNLYASLSERVSQTNRTLAKAVTPPPPGSLEVKIDPHGEPIPVREVGHDLDSDTQDLPTLNPPPGTAGGPA
jgi:hypothetical protein